MRREALWAVGDVDAAARAEHFWKEVCTGRPCLGLEVDPGFGQVEASRDLGTHISRDRSSPGPSGDTQGGFIGRSLNWT